MKPLKVLSEQAFAVTSIRDSVNSFLFYIAQHKFGRGFDGVNFLISSIRRGKHATN